MYTLCAAGVGSIPSLSYAMLHLQNNWFLGNLFAGLTSTSVAILASLPKKGMVLMSSIIILLSLVACGELVYGLHGS
ncbi:hypothetical protein MHB77_17105 [Paenibacillus sp. FSL K6-3166]|uniref:hypothetical protein n=1 Tax=Paenibacillus sp. FSL K6-3166 TaxID=2921492 RepID=UPI0030F6DCEB